MPNRLEQRWFCSTQKGLLACRLSPRQSWFQMIDDLSTPAWMPLHLVYTRPHHEYTVVRYCMDYDLGVHERPTKQATCAPPCCHIRLDPPEEILKRRNKTGCPQIFLQRLAFSSVNWHVEALPACMRNMMWLWLLGLHSLALSPT